MRRAAMLAVAATLAAGPGPGVAPAQRPYPERVEIRRTAHGVPHLRADDLGALGYGLAWVQIEDYADRLPLNLVRARGHLARAFGRDSIESDFVFRQTHAVAVRDYGRLAADTRMLFEGFAAGVNRYVATHAAEFPAWMPRDFTGPDVAALWVGRPSGGELAGVRRGLDAARARGEGSNAWAFAPSRTRSGHAILLRNPHLSWSAGYYEAHVTVPGVLDFYGDFRIGFPLLNVGGFNAALGWATTNNDPDLDEVYALALDPDRPDHYRFDGRSVALSRDTVRVEYRSGDSLAVATREVWRSGLGPVVDRRAGRVYVVRSPNDGELRKAEQFLRMMQARDLDEWLDALRLRAHTESNLTYADRDGNVFYIWNASIPDRPHAGGGDTAAIAAAGSADVWSRLVPLERLPQLRNPPGGYVQNANDPFHFTNLEAPLDSAAFPPFFPGPSLSFRSQLSLALATEQRLLTLEDVVRLKHSPRMLAAERLKDDLLAAVRADPGARTRLAPAVRVLESWDNTVAVGARGGVLFETWFNRYLEPAAGTPRGTAAERWRRAFARPWTAADPVRTPDGLADPAKAVRDLAWAAAETARRHGRIDPAWGEVHRVRRGSVDVPVAGCPGLLGCFRVLWFEDAPGGKRVAAGGDGWVLAVEFGPTPRAVSVLAYGESSRPDSPWHADQAAMFARGELKPVAFTEADIARSVVRRYRPE